MKSRCTAFLGSWGLADLPLTFASPVRRLLTLETAKT